MQAGLASPAVPAVSSLPEFCPPAAVEGRGVGETCSLVRAVGCAGGFPASRWARQVPQGPSHWPESQGTAAIFRAVLQWRGVPWLCAAGSRLLARGLLYAEAPAWEK